MKDYAEILQTLADTFGTTVEQLWGVMVRQAAISSTVDLFISVSLGLICFYGFRATQKKTAADEWDEVTWVVWAIFSVCSMSIIFGSLHSIIQGYLNPEYWALMRLI